MFVLFEVSSTPAGRAENLLSAEVLIDTGVRVMTKDEVDLLDLQGTDVNLRGADRFYVRVA